ncbi:MAG: prephenate dehydrogenase [Oscillospiraceae bacterium]|nr:prephenate dehydrogenase [Oscillospiraceae bacterium]
MNIGIIGMGLIGGSLCRALKTYTSHTVLGTTRNAATVRFAQSVGAIDAPLEDLAAADLCVVALPPEATMECLKARVGEFRRGAVVMDICGVKRSVVDCADRLYHDAGVHYVGTHPMAGKELAGFANSDADLYRGASLILTPTPLTHRPALETVRALALETGFGRVVEASPDEHDANIAYTSQLAHVVSSAYVKSPTCEKVLGFSAGSFQDMTRVAKLDPEMWTTLFLCNRGPLLYEIDVLMENLARFRAALDAENREELVAQLQRGRALREGVLQRQHGAAQD